MKNEVKNERHSLTKEIADMLKNLNDIKIRYIDRFTSYGFSETEAEMMVEDAFFMVKDYADHIIGHDACRKANRMNNHSIINFNISIPDHDDAEKIFNILDSHGMNIFSDAEWHMIF